MSDYYEFLGIDPSASAEQVQAACTAKEQELLRLVTDHNLTVVDEARRGLAVLKEARRTLTDPKARAAYDASHYWQCPNCGAPNRLLAHYCSKCGAARRAPALSDGVLPPASPTTLSMAPSTGPVAAPPPPVAPAAWPAPARAAAAPAEITRYGRAEYVSPMDLGQEYPLRLGLLLERHGARLLAGTRVRWTTLCIPASEDEPTIRIVPSSGYFRFSPPQRELRVKRDADVAADFKIVPLQIPNAASGTCDLTADFEHRGASVGNLSLVVQVQRPVSLGPIRIPHSYGRPLSVLGLVVGVLNTVSTLAGVAGLAGSLLRPPSLTMAGLSLAGVSVTGFGVAAVLLAVGWLLWRRVGRRRQTTF